MGERIELQLEEIPEAERVRSPDGELVAACYIASETCDRFDDDTIYEIRIWNLTTGKPVVRFVRSLCISHSSGSREGGAVSSIRFSDDSSSLIIVQDGDQQHEPISVERRERARR